MIIITCVIAIYNTAIENLSGKVSVLLSGLSQLFLEIFRIKVEIPLENIITKRSVEKCYKCLCGDDFKLSVCNRRLS